MNRFSASGLVTINVTDTMVTIDTRNRTIIAITGIGIEVTDPTRISEGMYPSRVYFHLSK